MGLSARGFGLGQSPWTLSFSGLLRRERGLVQILDSVIRGHGKKRRGWFCSLYIRKTVRCLTQPRVLRATEDRNLEFRGEPFLNDGSYGALIAHCSGGNGCCGTFTLGGYSLDGLLS